MSLKYEQYQALKHTQELLFDLICAKSRPKNVTELKKRVRRCLRHFPPLTKHGEPMFSHDNFNLPDNQ
jgi:hypothetical protein